ncbi:BhlA/UviB family holin-like peptide [Vallitalea sediminicola]
MEKEIMNIALTQGLWAVIAVALIFYILKAQEKRDIKQEERENNYQNVIKNLSTEICIIKDLKEDVETIKNYLIRKDEF